MQEKKDENAKLFNIESLKGKQAPPPLQIKKKNVGKLMRFSALISNLKG